MPPDPKMSTVLLLGDPVGGSLSPALQDAAFTMLGIDCRYLARQVLPEQLASVIDEIRADDRILGANVTIPHKESVVRLLDDLDDMAALDESGYSATGKRVAIIGAGGAARAVAAALRSTAATIWVLARNPDHAERLCQQLGLERGEALAMDWLQATIARADLVVNATPADLPPASWLRPDQRLFDLRSRRSPDGRAMLLHQGAAAFEIWTERSAPIEVMRAALGRAAEAVHA
ncbi:MAG: hypothetical protein E6I68_09940 [Chloroflexi bacterium]|nr:MAG: hypothetical protein E6I68_09940 [Chloroflexota bacterium]